MKMEKKLTKKELLMQLKNLGLVVIGTLVLAFGCAVFVVPFDLVTGGVTGISIIIDELIGGLLPIDVVIAVITWGLFFLGLAFLGWEFALKTLASTIIYPPAISLFMHLVSPNVLGGVFDLTTSSHANIALIISALFGGLCVGTGCALTFLGGGSTGGVDIIAFILCKFFKRWKTSTVIFIVDATTVILGLFVIKDLILTLLGVISAWIAAQVIDKVFIGGNRAFTAQIVSDKHEELNLAIREEVRRTTTMLIGYGGYSGASKTVLSVTFTMRQYAALMNVIKRIDPTAFVSITRAHEINGEGFTFGEHS
ncbi:MAG: YitT family protein [Clostridia bacterium]|nr:YitT family protein [Clostridia bacterium]